MPVILYERQRQILDYLVQYIQRNGYAPTLKDIGNAMGLSSLATVHEHLRQLVKKGVLRITGSGKNRRMEIIDKRLASPNTGIQLPIVGYLKEGLAIETYSLPNAFYNVTPDMVSTNRRCVILQVKDDTLMDEGLITGDLIILEEDPVIKDGDPVVVLIDDGLATFRRFYQEATRIRLDPINSQKKSIYRMHVRIQGKVVACIRKYN